jgi:hypothetical protein
MKMTAFWMMLAAPTSEMSVFFEIAEHCPRKLSSSNILVGCMSAEIHLIYHNLYVSEIFHPSSCKLTFFKLWKSVITFGSLLLDFWKQKLYVRTLYVLSEWLHLLCTELSALAEFFLL